MNLPNGRWNAGREVSFRHAYLFEGSDHVRRATVHNRTFAFAEAASKFRLITLTQKPAIGDDHANSKSKFQSTVLLLRYVAEVLNVRGFSFKSRSPVETLIGALRLGKSGGLAQRDL